VTTSDSELDRALSAFVNDAGTGGARAALDALARGLDQEPAGPMGEFRLLREIGRGGMGRVFEAEQSSVPGRHVAVKVLPAGHGASVGQARFAREIEVVGRLDHPNIVPILSADVDADPPWFAMKLVEGRSLEEWLSAQGGRTREYGVVAHMLRDLARALHHAHCLGVVHRDVNPRNVMVSDEGVPMLVDFGLALDDRSDPGLTLGGDTLGTVECMAPEQVSRKAGEVGPRTDVYGLGATLYRCLTGRAPFPRGDLHETFDAILKGDPPSPRSLQSEVPADLAAVCLKAMAPEPARRYLDAAALAEDLDAFLEYRPISAEGRSVVGRLVRAARRRPVASALLLLAVALVAGVLLVTRWWTPRSHLADLRQALAEGRTDDAHRELVFLAGGFDGSFWHEAATDAWGAALLQRFDDAEQRRGALMAEARLAHGRAAELLDLPPDPASDDGRAALAGELERLERDVADVEEELETVLERAMAAAISHEGLHAVAADHAARRLRRELDLLHHVFEPARCERWEQRLRLFDDTGRHASLLDHRARLSVDCPQGPARVVLVRGEGDDRVEMDLGTTPLGPLSLDEGRVTLILSRPDTVPTRLPLVLRRAAVQGPRETHVDADVMSRDELGEGWIHVPAGYSLLGERTERWSEQGPRWQWVGAFCIREREVDEVEYAELVTEGLDELFGEREPRAGVPMGGLGANDQDAVMNTLNKLEAQANAERPWFHRMARPEEWERAGRGADGRRYPWGDVPDMSRSWNFWSGTDAGQVPLIGPPLADDVSPFGVRDLSGSLREGVRPALASTRIGRGKVLIRGGSRNSRTDAELSLLSEQVVDCEDRPFDAGCRPVRVRLPPLAPFEPKALVDEFSTGDGMPPGWHAGLQDGEELGDDRRARVEGGALHIQGFGWHFSPMLFVWHEVALPREGFVVSADLSMEAGHPEFGDRTTFSLMLTDRAEWERRGPYLALHMSHLGLVSLSSFEGMFGVVAQDLPLHEPHTYELIVRGRQAEVRVWPVGADRPAQAQWSGSLPDDVLDRDPRVLMFRTGNLVATEARIERVEARPLP
jgi:hypothetical protein